MTIKQNRWFHSLLLAIAMVMSSPRQALAAECDELIDSNGNSYWMCVSTTDVACVYRQSIEVVQDGRYVRLEGVIKLVGCVS